MSQAIFLDTGSGVTGSFVRYLMSPPSPVELPFRMELLVCVINAEEKLEEVMNGLLRIGVTGATVVRSQGMGRVLSGELPAVAGLKSVMANARPQNITLFSVIQSRELMEAAIDVVTSVCGDMNNPSTGIMFSLPVSRVVGLAPQVEVNVEADGDRGEGVT